MSRRFSSLRRLYISLLRYINASRAYFFFAIALFIVGGILGFVGASHLSFLDALLRDIASKAEGLNFFQTFIFIFRNNVTSAFFALFLGVFFGLVPLFNGLLNGTVLGYVLAHAVPSHGFQVIWRIVPHGLFELPAIFLAIGCGLKLGLFVFDRTPREAFLSRFRISLAIFLYVVIPLLLVAAFIESILISFF